MKGFDPRWKDFPDYIIGITKEIWEDRGIATIYDYYGENTPVRSPASLVIGDKAVVAATMATLAELPDRTLLCEDVIWSGSPNEGMLSSHRVISTATHTGDGVYGKATGKKLVYRGIAECYAIDNRITDEWLVQDRGKIVRQLGWDPKDFARDLIDREGGPDNCVRPFTPDQNVAGPYDGKGNDNEWSTRYADILSRIMNAELAVIGKEYDRAVQLEYPGGVSGRGREDADRFWMGLRASFPSATFTIDHRIGRHDPMMPPRAAIRWSLRGKHDGWGAFGTPSGAEVYVMGASHVEFGPWGLRREYVLFDEVAIWKQIHLQMTNNHDS